MSNEIRIFAGIFNETEVSFIDIKTTDYFSVCADTSYIQVLDREEAEERVADRIQYDSEEKLRQLEYHDCKPSELLKVMVEDSSDQEIVEAYYDNSLYCNTWENKDDQLVFFNSSSCGQSELNKEEITKWYISEELFDKINSMWKKYHLKDISTVPQEELSELLELLQPYLDVDYDTEIENYFCEMEEYEK